MLKTIFAASVLASTLLSVPTAQAADWSFTYSTFRDDSTGDMNYNYRVEGSFSGEDINHNGWLERNELTTLVLGSTLMSPRDYMQCDSGWESGVRCAVDNFSYHIGRNLLINTHMDYHDEYGIHYNGTSFDSSRYDATYTFSPWYSGSTEMRIVPQTRVDISGPIPEPETYAMLGAGLLLLGTIARRRKV